MLEIILSGPRSHRSSALAALGRAGIGEQALREPDHGFHPKHVKKSEAWIAYRAEGLEEAAAAARHGYRVRLHRDARPLQMLEEQRAQQREQENPLLELVQGLETKVGRLEAELRALNGQPPPIAGGALETPPYVISAAEHPAYLFRQTMQSLMSATGVVNTGDLAVGAAGGMNVSVAAGLVWIPGTLGGSAGMGSNLGAQSSVSNTNGGTATNTGYPSTFTSQSNYLAYQDAPVSLAISAADPTNPRIDLVCASVQDAQYSGSSNQCLLQVVTGTPAATPAPPVPPASSVVLASVWVPAGASSISGTDIVDLRPGAARGSWLAPSASAVSATVAPGELLTMTGADTVAMLPSTGGLALGTVCGVRAGPIITGAGPITVRSDGGLSNIQLPGPGTTTPTPSFILGWPGASVVLLWDGTHWLGIEGAQDSGWILISSLGLDPNLHSVGGPFFDAACRLVGSRVWLHGGLLASGTPGTTLWTFPVGLRPGSTTLTPAVIDQSDTFLPAYLAVANTGAVEWFGPTIESANEISLDGLSFSLD